MRHLRQKILYPLIALMALGAGAFALADPGAVPGLRALFNEKTPDGLVVPVSSMEELVREAKRAKQKTVLRLAPGRYEGGYLSDVKSAAGLTIESANPADPAVIRGLTIKGSSGIRLRRLLFSTPLGQPGKQYLLLVMGSSNIAIDDVELVGEGDPATDKMISALMLRNCSDVRVSGSRFSRFRYALSFLGGDGITLERNELRDLRTDAIRGGGADNLTIRNNVIGNFQPANGDHPDGVQLWSNDQSRPAKNIVIADNLVVRDQGGIIQGVFVRDTKRQMPFENVEISGNLVIGSMYNGISLDGAHGAQISKNIVIPEGSQKSWIRVERAQDVDLTDNRAMLFIIGKEAKVRQKGSKHTGRLKGDMAPIIRTWLEARPALRDQPGPYLQRLAGLTTK
ncbi:MAG: right-handed parallel beta-helix repeat-containing protein [Sphingobium sp.]